MHVILLFVAVVVVVVVVVVAIGCIHAPSTRLRFRCHCLHTADPIGLKRLCNGNTTNQRFARQEWGFEIRTLEMMIRVRMMAMIRVRMMVMTMIRMMVMTMIRMMVMTMIRMIDSDAFGSDDYR